MLKRYLTSNVLEDLKEKMVFIGGPRQVGKTTFAKNLCATHFPGKFKYLNWDNREDKKQIIKGAFVSEEEIIIFDEIHKYPRWKNFIKGEYDKNKERYKIIVTGSSKLNVFRKGGDSLLGRYYYYTLHPLSLGEVLNGKSSFVFKTERISSPAKNKLSFRQSTKETKEIFERLFKFGGFPESFLKSSEKFLNRWHNQRVERVIEEDIRDVENLRHISSLDILAELLPEKVGSLLSVNSLREDLNVAYKTAALWVEILEKFYYHFRIYPYQTTHFKSLRKEPKLYFWDWSEIKDESKRFENMIASHLIKFCGYLKESEGIKTGIYFLRDAEGREVDFLVTIDNHPWFCIETKLSQKEIAKTLYYFSGKLNIPFKYQVIKDADIDYIRDNIRVISADKFLSALI